MHGCIISGLRSINWRSPVLLVHGDDDRNVPFQQTTDLVVTNVDPSCNLGWHLAQDGDGAARRRGRSRAPCIRRTA